MWPTCRGVEVPVLHTNGNFRPCDAKLSHSPLGCPDFDFPLGYETYVILYIEFVSSFVIYWFSEVVCCMLSLMYVDFFDVNDLYVFF